MESTASPAGSVASTCSATFAPRPGEGPGAASRACGRGPRVRGERSTSAGQEGGLSSAGRQEHLTETPRLQGDRPARPFQDETTLPRTSQRNQGAALARASKPVQTLLSLKEFRDSEKGRQSETRTQARPAQGPEWEHADSPDPQEQLRGTPRQCSGSRCSSQYLGMPCRAGVTRQHLLVLGPKGSRDPGTTPVL